MSNENTTTTTTTTDVYRAATKVYEAISDPATPDPVRMALTDEIAHEITGIIPQLDFSNRAVVCALWPLVLELGRVALFDPDGPTVRDIKVIPISKAA